MEARSSLLVINILIPEITIIKYLSFSSLSSSILLVDLGLKEGVMTRKGVGWV